MPLDEDVAKPLENISVPGAVFGSRFECSKMPGVMVDLYEREDFLESPDVGPLGGGRSISQEGPNSLQIGSHWPMRFGTTHSHLMRF